MAAYLAAAGPFAVGTLRTLAISLSCFLDPFLKRDASLDGTFAIGVFAYGNRLCDLDRVEDQCRTAIFYGAMEWDYSSCLCDVARPLCWGLG